jgi:hypothetical protein
MQPPRVESVNPSLRHEIEIHAELSIRDPTADPVETKFQPVCRHAFPWYLSATAACKEVCLTQCVAKTLRKYANAALIFGD